jgi:hypothetical protein
MGNSFDFSIVLIFYLDIIFSTSNRNEYQKQKNNVSREQSAVGA